MVNETTTQNEVETVEAPQWGETADGTAPLSREEVLAQLEQEDNRLPVRLVKADGTDRANIKLPPENVTRFIVFDGKTYERTSDASGEFWAEQADQSAAQPGSDVGFGG